MSALTGSILESLFSSTDNTKGMAAVGIVSELPYLPESLRSYFAKTLSPMRALELFAKAKAVGVEGLEKSIPPKSRLPDYVYGKLDWRDDRRLEPMEVLDYLKKIQEPEVQDMCHKLLRNLNSIVLLAHEELIINREALDKGNADHAILQTLDLKGKKYAGMPIYPLFPYADQPSVDSRFSVGTGFFISKQEVATAFHVMRDFKDKKPFKEMVIISGFYIKPGEAEIKIPRDHIFKMKEDSIPDISDVNSDDQVRFQIKPAYHTSFFPEPAIISTEPITCGTDVYMLGHGLGLPVKLSWNGPVINTHVTDTNLALCKIETFKGNSGSPVFDSGSHKVVGIMKGNDNEEVVEPKKDEHGIMYHIPSCYLHGSFAAQFSRINNPKPS